ARLLTDLVLLRRSLDRRRVVLVGAGDPGSELQESLEDFLARRAAISTKSDDAVRRTLSGSKLPGLCSGVGEQCVPGIRERRVTERRSEDTWAVGAHHDHWPTTLVVDLETPGIPIPAAIGVRDHNAAARDLENVAHRGLGDRGVARPGLDCAGIVRL